MDKDYIKDFKLGSLLGLLVTKEIMKKSLKELDEKIAIASKLINNKKLIKELKKQLND
jgi:hypothetical protein